MQIRQALTHAVVKFKEANIQSSYLDARILLGHVLNQPIEYLLVRDNENLTNTDQENFFALIKRRLALEPIAYIVGYKEFYGRTFKVNEKVLIPRPDTEVLIDAVLSFLPTYKDNLRILDLGTGSGCIIISLLLEIAFASAIAIDISNDALSVARQNARIHQVDNRLKLIHSQWFENLNKQKFDIIVSNPPYISETDKDLISQETIDYEPAIALFAQRDGLNAYYSIATSAKNFLKQDGKLFIEIGFNQESIVSQIFTSHGYVVKQIYRDIAKHARVICISLEA
jgi:release factor glutamine methyltransferase